MCVCVRVRVCVCKREREETPSYILADLGMSNFECRISESNDKFNILKFESRKPGWYILVSKEYSWCLWI